MLSYLFFVSVCLGSAFEGTVGQSQTFKSCLIATSTPITASDIIFAHQKTLSWLPDDVSFILH